MILSERHLTHANSLRKQAATGICRFPTSAVADLNAYALGVVEITVFGRQAGELHGAIVVRAKGRPSPLLNVPVSGEFRAPVEITPAEIIFPRRSATGLLYSSSCLVRSTAGNALSARVGPCPTGLACRIDSGKGTSIVRLTITFHAEQVGSVIGEKRLIMPVQVSDGGVERELSLVVVVRPPD